MPRPPLDDADDQVARSSITATGGRVVFHEGGVLVLQFGLDRLGTTCDDLWRTLAPDERQRAARYAIPEQRDRFVARRGLLRQVLSLLRGTAPEAIRFRYDDTGKPELVTDGQPPLYFSTSSSGAAALIAVSPSHPVGVDIERVQPDIPLEAMIADWLSPTEAALFRQTQPPRHHDLFFSLWARKEAYLKAVGTGIGAELSRVSVAEPGNDLSLPFRVEEGGAGTDVWVYAVEVVYQVGAEDEYRAAVAVVG